MKPARTKEQLEKLLTDCVTALVLSDPEREHPISQELIARLDATLKSMASADRMVQRPIIQQSSGRFIPHGTKFYASAERGAK